MANSDAISKPVECSHCRVEMKILTVKKYQGKWPVTLIVTGVLCCLFVVGALVGIPLLLLGIYMATAQETIRVCPDCRRYFKVWAAEQDSA